MPFDVIVVAYNRLITGIEGMSTFASSMSVQRIVICDNSTDEMILAKNSELATAVSEKVTYVPMGGNVGLAKAYNRGLRYCLAEYVAIFDDDTFVSDDYFTKAGSYCQLKPADIYLPIVRSNKIIMSPCTKRQFSFKAIGSVDELCEGMNISAINSGMIVRRDFYRLCSYDENLFLDDIDHKSLDDARALGVTVVVMKDVNLRQRYSQEMYDEKGQISRLRIRARDSRVYYGNSLYSRLYSTMLIQYWKIKIAIKYKKISVLFMSI